MIRLLSLPSMTELKKFVRDKHSSLPCLSAMDKLKRFNRLTLRQGNEQLCLQVLSQGLYNKTFYGCNLFFTVISQSVLCLSDISTQYLLPTFRVQHPLGCAPALSRNIRQRRKQPLAKHFSLLTSVKSFIVEAPEEKRIRNKFLNCNPDESPNHGPVS